MRLVLATAYYTYRSQAWLSPAMIVAQKVVLPLGQITFFGLIGTHLGDQPLSFYVVGNAIAVSAVACVYIGWAMAAERQAGMLIYIVAAPANPLTVFFGRSASYIGDGLLRIVLGLIWAAVAFGVVVGPDRWAGMLLIALTAALAACGAGLLVGGLCYILLDATVIGNAAMYALLVVGGANIPRDALPPLLQAAGSLLPVTRSIAAARDLTAGSDIPSIAPLLMEDLAIGFIYGLVGFGLFRWLEKQARRRGTLEGM